MQHDKFISVIMPVYDGSIHIAESIFSVISQTYHNWELIVVDDGSTDNTGEIVKKIAEGEFRIKYICQENGGQGKARNRGIKEASGEIIGFIDADDLWMSNKLESQVEFIQSTNADVVFSDVTIMDFDGVKQRHTWGVINAVYAGDEGKLAFMQENKVPLLSAFVKKVSIIKVNGFNEDKDKQYVEDYDLWLRMLESGANFASSSEKLACYRLNTHKTPERKKTLINVIDVLKKVSIRDISLKEKKNRALTLWARRVIKRCSPIIDQNDMRRIISLFPSPFIRSLFFLLNYISGPSVVSKMILIFTRKLIIKGS